MVTAEEQSAWYDRYETEDPPVTHVLELRPIIRVEVAIPPWADVEDQAGIFAEDAQLDIEKNGLSWPSDRRWESLSVGRQKVVGNSLFIHPVAESSDSVARELTNQ